MATDWAAIEFEFVHSSATYKQVADKHGVTESALRKRGSRHNWMEKRHKVSQLVTDMAAIQRANELSTELTKMNADDLRLAKGIKARVAKLLNRQVDSDGHDELGPLQLRQLASAHESAQRVSRLAIGATTGNTGLSTPDGSPLLTGISIELVRPNGNG